MVTIFLPLIFVLINLGYLPDFSQNHEDVQRHSSNSQKLPENVILLILTQHHIPLH